MGRTELDIGAQATAAQAMQDAAASVSETLRQLVATIEANETGFRGAAAAGFADAVSAWVNAAAQLPSILESTGHRLAATDATVAATEQRQTSSFGRIGQVLGGEAP